MYRGFVIHWTLKRHTWILGGAGEVTHMNMYIYIYHMADPKVGIPPNHPIHETIFVLKRKVT